MGWRVVVISSSSKLSYISGYMSIRTVDNSIRIHLSEIAVLILETTNISLTTALLVELSKNKIDIIVCDEKHMPYAQLLPFNNNSLSSLNYQNQSKWTIKLKNDVWKEIAIAKISGQAALLKSLSIDKYKDLETYRGAVNSGDTTNREGHAAKVYFNALFGTSFSRDKESYINTALDYGYSIILSAVAREICAAGYCTQIGIHHKNVHNAYNLASDLMEPFRPFVDKTVVNMKIEQFTHNEKMILANVLNEEVDIVNTKQYLINAVRIYVRSFFSAMSEHDISQLKFPECNF